MKTLLILAGFDPGAGAGLQQDLKTATLLGVYGLTVVTALTVQNSLEVQAVHPVDPEVVAAQMNALLADFPIDAVKIGMLGSGAIVRTVAGRLKQTPRVPVVLDPVLAAGGDGAPLLNEAGIPALKEELFPLTFLLTPNAPEAARLTGLEVKTPEQLEDAARRLTDQGPQWVLAKGGHLPGEPVDILTDGKNSYRLRGRRIHAPHNHGSGCLVATACAAGLAKGVSLPETVNQARRLVAQALRWGLPLGRGRGPVNPYAPFARDLARYEVLEALRNAAERLQEEDITPLIPETMTNLGYAAPYAEGSQDVAAFPGRLVRTPRGVVIPAPPAFGASRHTADLILAAMTVSPELRSAMNIRHFEEVEELARRLHLRAAALDAEMDLADPAIFQTGQNLPDLIRYPGAGGREPMVFVLGLNPMAVAEKALALKNALQAAGKL
jgi:hydroxymethylpyrimidine/phosphomethylpyrimidine kinase